VGSPSESDVNWLREAYRRQQRPYLEAVASLEALDEAGFDQMWKTDLVVHDARAGDLLDALAEGMDVQLEDRLVPGPVLDQRVTLELRGVSRFEAMDRVCDAIGIHADPLSQLAVPPEFVRTPRGYQDLAIRSWWEATSLQPYVDFVSPLEFMGFPADSPHDPNMLLTPPRRPIIVLAPGPSPGQRCSIGPFTVIAARPVEFPGDMCGSIGIAATFAGIPNAGRRILEQGGLGREPNACVGRFRCRIEIDEEEAGHLDRGSATPHEGQADSSMGLIPLGAGVRPRLVRLGPDVREIKVSGRIVAWLPGEVETIRIDAPGTGPRRIERPSATASIGERFRRPEFAGRPEFAAIFELPVDIEVPEDSTVTGVALDERGVPYEQIAMGGPVAGEVELPAETPRRVILRSLLRLTREPAAILIKVVHAQVAIGRPFALSIPLARFASQPAGLKPLEIDGEKPLVLVAVSGTDGETYFRLINRSNKGIVRVGYSLIDFLVDKTHGFAMARDIKQVDGYEPLEGVIVPVGGTVDCEPDFSYRKNPDGGLPALRVDEVEFTDGTVWGNPDSPPAR